MLPQGGLQRHLAGSVQKHSAARAQAGSHVIVYFVFMDFFSSHEDLHAGSHGGPAAWFVQFVQRGPPQVQSAASEAVRHAASPRVAKSVKQRRRMEELQIRPLGKPVEPPHEAQGQVGALYGKTLVLTGSLPTLSRTEASDLIRNAGGSVTGSISKNTDFLLAGKDAGSKLARAKGLGVAVITEAQFRDLLGNSPPQPSTETRDYFLRDHSPTREAAATPRNATNRQKKLLRFFAIPFGPTLTIGAAGMKIEELMSDECNREHWKKYLFLTEDLDSDSDELKPFSPADLAATKVPDGWSGSQAIENYEEELAAKIVREESPFDHPQPKVVFSGKTFLFTGQFAFGSRKECQRAVEILGGVTSDQKQVSHAIDYLVVGTAGNKTWSKGSYGNKIERGVLIRRQHGRPAIISEEHWVTAIRGSETQLSLLA